MALIRITVSEDSKGVFWIGRGRGKAKVSTLSYLYEDAMMIAESEFKSAGGEGKALIIDRVKKK